MNFLECKTLLRREYSCTVVSGTKRGLYNLIYKYSDMPEKNHTLESWTQEEIIEMVEKAEATSAEEDKVFEGMDQ